MSKLKWWLRKLYAMCISRNQNEITYFKYIEDGGEFLRLDYPLGKEALIFDVGGHTGNFTDELTQKFDCKIDVFEPVAAYAETIRERFTPNSNIHVEQVGLGGSDKEAIINIEGLGSSVYGDGAGNAAGKESIRIISAVDYIESKKYSLIDLITINIEGGEYELLNSILDHPGLAKRIRYIQIQFHDFVPDAQQKRAGIQRKLSKTHELMWDYPYIWESWELKKG